MCRPLEGSRPCTGSRKGQGPRDAESRSLWQGKEGERPGGGNRLKAQGQVGPVRLQTRLRSRPPVQELPRGLLQEGAGREEKLLGQKVLQAEGCSRR